MISTLKYDKKARFLGISLIFLVLGVCSSPTIVGGYHILIFIPAVLVYLSKTYKVKISKSSWALLALFVWGIICGIYNLDTLVKPKKSFDDMKFYLSGFALIIPLRYYFERSNSYQVKKLINILCVVLIASFFVGISKSWLGFDLLTFKKVWPNYRSEGFIKIMRYGYSSALLFLLMLSMTINRKKINELITPKLFYPAMVLSFFAIFAAQTRGALVALMVGLPWLLLRYRPKIASLIIGVGVLFLSVVAYFSITGNKTDSRMLTVNDESSSIRMSQFYAAYKAVEESPIFGFGPVQFSSHVTRIKMKYDIWAKDFVGHAHNIFLEHAANFGIPGLIFLLAFFGFWFFEMIKLKTDFGWGISTYILAFVASGQFENLFDNTNAHILFFVYAFSQIFSLYKGEEKVSEVLKV